MKKYALIFTYVIINISCNGQKKENKKQINMELEKTAPYNIEYVGDGTTFQYDSLSKEIIERGKMILKNFNFKFPSDKEYSERIKSVFGWDIGKYPNKIIVLKPSMFPDIVVKNDNYILFQEPDVNDKYEIESTDLYQYNNYIFYKNKQSFNVLKAKNPILLKDLFINYGYTEDKDLSSFVLKDFDFSNQSDFHDLIFSYNPETKKYQIRENMMDDIENIIYGGKTKELLSEAKEGEGYNSILEIMERIYKDNNDYEKGDWTIAFLMEKCLNVGIIGYPQNFLHNHYSFINKLERENYYGFERLKGYVENNNVIAPIDDSNTETYTIQDPDGYTNLRKEKNAQSAILQKIKSGESIEILDNTGDWWQVKTKEGKTGYVHKSRIKSGNSGSQPTSLLLHSRPDFGSFAQEITVKGEVEYVRNISGWDFVKVNGTTGYLPSEALKQQQAAAEKSKHSFLADEDDIKPEKKKGFWGNLFG